MYGLFSKRDYGGIMWESLHVGISSTFPLRLFWKNSQRNLFSQNKISGGITERISRGGSDVIQGKFLKEYMQKI